MNWPAAARQLLTDDGSRAQTFRFLISGGVNTVLAYLFFLAIYWTFGTPFWAFNIAFVLGILTSYLLNLKFTFRGRHSTKKLSKFPVTYLIHYVGGISLLKLWLHLGIPAEIAVWINTLLLCPVTFLVARFILR